jgi:uncharacterized repeat protein (TIGR02543 family)
MGVMMRKLLFLIGILTFFLSSCGSTLEVTVNFESNGGTQVPSQVFNEESVFTLPNEPTKEGHTFLGWFLDQTYDTPFSVEGVLALEPEDTLTLYASWEVNQYTITFDSDGGSAVSAITQDYETAVTAPTNPTKEGYTFSGWSASVPETMPAEDTTLTATWTINQYTITFDSDGGSAVSAITQDYETSITVPANPTKEGYTFSGWSASIPTTMPAENLTLTATWTINQYTITFDTDGGSIVSELTLDYGTEISLPSTPTKENFIFMGWSPVIPDTMPATNLTVKALWEYDPEIVGSSPVYQGMDVASVSNSQASLPLSFRSYRETTMTSGINDEIPTIDIPEQPDFTYYANPNEVILVRVYLTNPDSQVILRFKLNGVIYQSFEFQEGSNSELLIVKVNAGAISGTKELTIDEIKYVENVSNLIKDAEFEGERTIQMGVTYQHPLEAVISNEVITATSYQSTITITDTDDLITVYENPPVFYLFDGTSIVYTQILNVGSNTIEYQQLKTDQSFEYAIAMTYDLLDGEGVNAYIALQNIKRTEKIFEITSVTSTQTSLVFELNINDQKNVGDVTAIELYQGDTLVESLSDLSLRTFDNLLSNNTYEIKVTYTYDLNDGVGEQLYNIKETINTFSKATPSVEITNMATTQESVTFELYITDTDQVGEVTAIQLYLGETLVESLSDLSLRSFENLLSNNTYEIKVIYNYDINEGNGIEQIILTQSQKTLAKSMPIVSLNNINTTNNNVTFAYTETDLDGVGELVSIELYEGETLVESLSDLSLRVFDNLTFNTAYEIKVTYEYNINDGNGTITIVEYYDAITEGYYLSFVTNLTGVTINRVMLIREKDFELPSNLEKEGYSLEGWYFEGYEELFDLSVPLTQDTTIYAKWVINQYTINFNENGGSEVTSITQDYATEVTAPEDPIKSGYTFNGWYSDIARTRAYLFTTIPSRDVELYAKWTFNQAYDVYGISDALLESTGTLVTLEGYVTSNIDTNIYFIQDDTGAISIDATNASNDLRMILQDAWSKGYAIEIQGLRNVVNGLELIDTIEFINTKTNIGFSKPSPITYDGTTDLIEFVSKEVKIYDFYVTSKTVEDNSDLLIIGTLNGESLEIRMTNQLIQININLPYIDVNSYVTLLVSVSFENQIELYIDNSSDKQSFANYPNGIDLSLLDGEQKDILFAAAESYLLENLFGGVPLYTNYSSVMFSNRIQLFSEDFNGVLGYGTAFSQLSADDSTVEMFPGQMGNVGEYTYRSSYSIQPKTLNPWLDNYGDFSDFIDLFTGGFYEFFFDASKTGYEILPSFAESLPIAVNPTTINGKDYSTVWQIPLRDDLTWTFHPDIDTSEFAEGYEKLDASDWIWTWKLALENRWDRAISGGDDFITKGIKGVAEFVAGTGSWEDVGISIVNGNTIQLEYVSEQSEFDIIYGFNGASLPALNQELFESLGASFTGRATAYGQDHLSVAANGVYYLNEYSPYYIITAKKNNAYVDADKYFYTGQQFRFIEGSTQVFEEFLAGRLESASVPSASVIEFLNDPRVKTSPLATTWRLQMNMFGTEANRDAYIAQYPGSGIDPDFVPEPILMYKEFRQALYYGFDRYTAAVEVVKTYLPAHTLFTSTYFLDGSSGLSVRTGEAGAAVVTNFGGDSNGYFPDAALDLFKSAVADAIADGYYIKGTASNYTTIELTLTHASSGNTSQLAMVAELERQYEALLVDDENFVNVDIIVNDVAFPGNYYDYMLVANTDLGIGGITGSLLDAIGFLDKFSEDNRSGFTLNWGIETSVPNIEVTYINLEGNYVSEVWSYDALISALAGKTYVGNGIELGIKIEDALKIEISERVKIRGYVTMNIDGNNFLLQDETGALDLFLGTGSSEFKDAILAALESGDLVEIIGTRNAFRGLEQLSNLTSVTVVPVPEVSFPVIVDVTSLDQLPNLVAQLVRLRNLEVVSIAYDGFGNLDITAKLGTETVVVRWDSRTGTPAGLPTELEAGDIINVVAGVYFNNVPLLRIDSPDDIVMS